MEASPHCSVRLECVMHAASVHPEPGSNSRKFSIITRISARHNLKLEFPFASFEFSRFTSFVFKGIVEISFCLVVQFSRTVSLSLALALFFTFQLPFSGTSCAPHRTAWLFYHTSIPLVNTFFKKNRLFCAEILLYDIYIILIIVYDIQFLFFFIKKTCFLSKVLKVI